MKRQAILGFLLFLWQSVNCQTAAIDQSRPENVLNAVFDAAKTQKFDLVGGLCVHAGKGDGDTRKLCGIAYEQQQGAKDAFVIAFKDARIEGTLEYKTVEGEEYALIGFSFGPTGETKMETMSLVKRKDKWYLSGF